MRFCQFPTSFCRIPDGSWAWQVHVEIWLVKVAAGAWSVVMFGCVLCVVCSLCLHVPGKDDRYGRDEQVATGFTLLSAAIIHSSRQHVSRFK